MVTPHEVLRAEFYFDFGAHPFDHAALFKSDLPVHAALRELPAYLNRWFRYLREGHGAGASSPVRLLARVVPRPTYPRAEEGHEADARWYVDGEHLRTCLNASPHHHEGAPSRAAVEVYHLFKKEEEEGEGPHAPMARRMPVVEPASFTGGTSGGRLYVGAGSRLTGCHLDLSQGDIYIGEGTTVDPFASLCGPTIVGRHSAIRTGARVRGNCIFGDRVVVGGEVKSSVLMNEASFPHQSYVGDSICGFRSHFGNGATSANLGIYEGMKEESQFSELVLLVPSGNEGGRTQHAKVNAGTAKLGIIMGDFSQVGCNSVSDPATFLGPRTIVYALTSIRKGFYGPNEVLKNKPLEAGVIERAPFLPNRL